MAYLLIIRNIRDRVSRNWSPEKGLSSVPTYTWRDKKDKPHINAHLSSTSIKKNCASIWLTQHALSGACTTYRPFFNGGRTDGTEKILNFPLYSYHSWSLKPSIISTKQNKKERKKAEAKEININI